MYKGSRLGLSTSRTFADQVFKKDDTNAIIYYSGETDAIDEIIAFGYSNKMGVGVARVIGENMNLNNIMKMMQNTKIDGSNLDLNQFKNLFGKTTISTAKKQYNFIKRVKKSQVI